MFIWPQILHQIRSQFPMLPATFPSGAETLNWQVQEPVTANGGAVVLVYGSEGMVPPWSNMILSHAKSLASLGFIAVVPDYFQKGKGTPHGNSDAVFTLILKRHAEWEQALADAATAVGQLPHVDHTRIGFVGYSLGGFLSLRVRNQVKVLCEFFAPYQFPTFGSSPVLAGIGSPKNASLKAQIHHGDNDKIVPYSPNATSIESDLKAEGAAVELHQYSNAGHGFAGSDADNTTALASSTKSMLNFMKANL
jgi:dienelactone hydrolase